MIGESLTSPLFQYSAAIAQEGEGHRLSGGNSSTLTTLKLIKQGY